MRPQPGQIYEETACASCAMVEERRCESGHPCDPATFESRLLTQHPAYAEDQERLQEVIRALGTCVRRLVNLSTIAPDTFRMVEAKLHAPELSYAQLAELFNCSRQNILYHFRKAVQAIPELAYALAIDIRHLPPHCQSLKAQTGKERKASSSIDEDPVIRAKLDNPMLSISELSRRFQIRRATIRARFRRAAELVPELADSLMIARKEINARRPLSDRYALFKIEHPELGPAAIARRFGAKIESVENHLYRMKKARPEMQVALCVDQSGRLARNAEILRRKNLNPGLSAKRIAQEMRIGHAAVEYVFRSHLKAHPELREVWQAFNKFGPKRRRERLAS